jgi:hypothetical protein
MKDLEDLKLEDMKALSLRSESLNVQKLAVIDLSRQPTSSVTKAVGELKTR